MTQRFQHLAQRLINTPLMLDPRKAAALLAAVGPRFGVGNVKRPQAFDDDGDLGFGDPAGAPQFDRHDIVDNKGKPTGRFVAVVPIFGTLVNRLSMMDAYSGFADYGTIRSLFLSAVRDESVAAIILQVDSPGGEVSGCFDLVDTIFEARKAKPIWALLDDMACSAAYALASAASHIVMPRTGTIGSIGVLCVLADVSKMLTDDGITVNVFQFGARKADGMPEIPLPPEARSRFQADVDALGELFCETVARNRGISANAVRATQAMTYLGADGVRLALADEVMAPDAAVTALLKKL